MSERLWDLEGTVVSLEEAAKDLGFKDVFELRRWQTEAGQKISELERQLSEAKRDAASFRWHLRRHGVVLEHARSFIEQQPGYFDPAMKQKLLFGIDVVVGGKGVVDWKHVLKDWLEPINEEMRKQDDCDAEGKPDQINEGS